MVQLVIQIVIVLFSLLAGGAVAISIYLLFARLHGRGPLGRWLARSVAGVASFATVIAIVLATGQGAILSRTGEAPSWGRR